MEDHDQLGIQTLEWRNYQNANRNPLLIQLEWCEYSTPFCKSWHKKRSKRKEDFRWSSLFKPSNKAESFWRSFLETQDSQWDFDPMGLPRISMLQPWTRIMLDSIEKQSRWPLGRINSHFCELTTKPNSAPDSLIISQAFSTSGTEPNKLPSMYQEFKDRVPKDHFVAPLLVNRLCIHQRKVGCV